MKNKFILQLLPCILIVFALMAACDSEIDPDTPPVTEDPVDEDPNDNDPPRTPRDPDRVVDFGDEVILFFAPKDEGAELMGTSDAYTSELSRFDLISRTRNQASIEEEDYLEFASQQALDWTQEERQVLTERFLEIKEKIQSKGLKLDFPDEILLVKSTMAEEGNAVSYTRENFIVLRGIVNESSLVHGLFHILVRYNPEKENELYKTINFHETNRIEYPEAIKDLVITNPDGPFLHHTIKLEIEGQEEEVVFILISEEEWDGGSFFDYMKQRLMLIEGGSGAKAAKLVDQQPVLKSFDAATNLEQKVGRNTTYRIHPAEILAQHFVSLVLSRDVPDPSFIDAMRDVLTQ